MQFTGERWVPGHVDPRIEDDHLSRYHFALPFCTGKRVLDIACGVGAGSHLLVTRGQAASVEGVDISPETIEYARQTYQHPQLAFHVGDAEKYTAAVPFDVITCFETIEHVPNHTLVIANLKSWLKPGGTLLISSPNRPITSPLASTIDDKPTNSFHVREFTPRELSQFLVAAGFKDVKEYGQRLRMYFRSGTVESLLNRARRLIGRNPDHDTSAAVVPFRFLTPRYFVLTARG